MSRFRANRTKSSSFPLSRIAFESRSTFTQTERVAGGRVARLSLSLSPRLSQGRRTEKENVRIPPFPLVLPIEARKEHARDNIKRCANEKRKNRNLWTRLSERCPPSWSRLTTGVDQRNFAITLLPSSLFPIYLSIYLSRSLSLFFFYRSLSPPPLSFPYLLVLSR